jgi:hypothetical protein
MLCATPIWPVLGNGLNGASCEAQWVTDLTGYHHQYDRWTQTTQVFGEENLKFVVLPIHPPPLCDIKVLSLVPWEVEEHGGPRCAECVSHTIGTKVFWKQSMTWKRAAKSDTKFHCGQMLRAGGALGTWKQTSTANSRTRPCLNCLSGCVSRLSRHLEEIRWSHKEGIKGDSKKVSESRTWRGDNFSRGCGIRWPSSQAQKRACCEDLQLVDSEWD